MDLELVKRLVDAASIAAIVDQAVSWHERPATLGFPSIVLTIAAPGREYTHGGADGLDEPRVQLDMFGLDAVELITLKRAVIAEMELPRDVDGIRFHEGFLETEFTPPAEILPDGRRAYRVTHEWSFFWENLS